MLKILIYLLLKLEKKEGVLMMAMLFAQRVILGKSTFDDVPTKLRPQVAEILIDSGLVELVPEEYRQ